MVYEISNGSKVNIEVGNEVKFLDGYLTQLNGDWVLIVQTDVNYIYINLNGVVTALTPLIISEVK